MSKKRTIRRRGLSAVLALSVCFGLLPPTAGAAVTAEHDWEIFDASDTYNLPGTQEQILQEMIRNPEFAEKWAAIANNVLPKTYYNDNNEHGYHEPYTALTAADYAKVQYTAKGLRDAVSSVVDQSAILSGSGVLNSLPEEETPVYYVSTRAEKERDDHHSYVSTGYGYYVQAFYDFEIQGIADRFETPSIEANDTTASLEKKGYQFNLGGSSDSYKVTAENRNDFENTVEKSYTYEKSTTTSTTVSNTYSQNWTEETTVGVEFSVPVLAALSPTAKVEQSFSYSYGMEKTYESSKEESYAQSITDTISVPLPAHTGLDINVDVTDLQTTIPYTGAVRIKYKTMLIYVTGCYLDGKSQGHKWYSYKGDGRKSGVYTFGRNGLSAIEDLDARIQNRDVTGYDPDGLDMSSLYQGAFKTAADQLRSGQPVAPYFGSFHYTSKNTVITPQKVYPIYALHRLVPDTDQISLYEQQSLRLDSIKVEAKNEFDVDWYGFNPRLSGEWTVVDEDLNDASEYAKVTTNRNGYPVLEARKPNDGKPLFLRYQPKASIETTADFNSELVGLTILPVALSSVTVTGSFEPFYFKDGSNTTDVSGLTVTAKDENDENFDVTGRVKWSVEDNDGLTIDETTGDIKFTQPGNYQIYAIVNDTESNRVPLQVLPERQLETLTVNGTIPDLIYNDDTANTFDLSTLDVEAKDQYGEDMTLDERLFEWRLATDKGYAAIQGSTLTGLVVGTQQSGAVRGDKSLPLHGGEKGEHGGPHHHAGGRQGHIAAVVVLPYDGLHVLAAGIIGGVHVGDEPQRVLVLAARGGGQSAVDVAVLVHMGILHAKSLHLLHQLAGKVELPLGGGVSAGGLVRGGVHPDIIQKPFISAHKAHSFYVSVMYTTTCSFYHTLFSDFLQLFSQHLHENMRPHAKDEYNSSLKMRRSAQNVLK